MTLKLHNLYKLIENLMDITLETTDQNMKVKYALVEKKAIGCYDCIESSLS